MGLGTALKISQQVIKHAPKLKKASRLTNFQKIIRGVKSSTKVIQQKLKTKQNLAQISEKIGDARNFITQNSAIRNMNSSITRKINTNPAILKNIRNLKNTKELSGYLKSYFGGGVPKALPANASRLAKLRAGLGPLTSKVFFGLEAAEALYDGLRTDAPKVRDTGNIGTVLLNPIAGGQADQSITNSIRNLATNVKHIGNQKQYKRTKLAGASMLKIDNTFWNPFDDNYKMVPNMAMRHNKRAESLAKLDAREARNKEKSDAK